MFLKKIFKRPLTVAFRLGIGYALMFLILSLGVFASVYLLMQARLHRQIDESLWEEVQEYDFLFETQGMKGIETELSQEDNREDTRAMFFRLLDSEGKELSTSDPTAWKDFDFQLIKPRESKGRRTLVETFSAPETTHGHIRVLTHWRKSTRWPWR